MKSFFKKPFLLILITQIALYSRSIGIYFSADDWFHLRVSQINTITEFLKFFSFERNAQTISFYRPLSTQVFFFTLQKLFGLNPVPYHLFVTLCFCLSLYLAYKSILLLSNSKRTAIFSVIIYGFSVSNFTRLYFLSAFQEIALVILSLLCLISHIENRKNRALLFFILALTSKETAVIIPILILITDWFKKRVKLSNYLPYFIILLPYLYLRFHVFGTTTGDSYSWNFSPLKALNTFSWYSLWSIGAPELLVDYIGSGFRPIPRFFTDFVIWWPFIIFPLLILIVLSLYLFFKYYGKSSRDFVFGLLFFLASLSPVLFLPTHKFTLELGLPLIGFSMAIFSLFTRTNKITYIFLFVYIFYNLSMNYLTYTTHYSVNRAKVSQKIYKYFLKKYPTEPIGSYFEFINDTTAYTKEWGSSKQIANSIGESELFRVIYHDSQYQVFFEDIPGNRPPEQRIPISSKMFLE